MSGHLLSLKAGVQVEAGWPCSGPLLRLAEKVARKLLPGRLTADFSVLAALGSNVEFLLHQCIALQLNLDSEAA